MIHWKTDPRNWWHSAKTQPRPMLLSCAALLIIFTMFLVAVVLRGGSKAPAVTPQQAVRLHPVFHTPLTGHSSARPAIRSKSSTSESWWTRAELYLTVQSSRFPKETQIILPINVGDFAGCRTRFIQLPFEVQEGDVLLFNLLDEDELTSEEEQMLLGAAALLGTVWSAAGALYAPSCRALTAPVLTKTAAILGQVVLQDIRQHKFEHYGDAEFIVPWELPQRPQDANKLTLLNDRNYAYLVLKLYGPPTPIPLAASEI